MACKIVNNSNLKLGKIEDLVQSLVNFAKDRMNFANFPTISFESDEDNSLNLLGKTGYYNPETNGIHIYTNSRHPKDMLRSIAHELIHHRQNEDGFFSVGGYTGSGYAQKNSHLRKMESEAYEQGNMCFRDWEDGIKDKTPTIYNEWRKNNMSLENWKNRELQRLLLEKFNISAKIAQGPVEEECAPPEELDAEGPMGVVEPMEPEGSVESLVATAMDAIQDLADAAGAGPVGDVEPVGEPVGEELAEEESEEGNPAKVYLDRASRRHKTKTQGIELPGLDTEIGKGFSPKSPMAKMAKPASMTDPEEEEAEVWGEDKDKPSSETIQEALKIAMNIIEKRLGK